MRLVVPHSIRGRTCRPCEAAHVYSDLHLNGVTVATSALSGMRWLPKRFAIFICGREGRPMSTKPGFCPPFHGFASSVIWNDGFVVRLIPVNAGFTRYDSRTATIANFSTGATTAFGWNFGPINKLKFLITWRE